MGVHIVLHRVLYLESYLNCTEDLACTSRPPNGSVNFFCVMWAGSPAGSHKKRTKLQEVGHDAATVWLWRTGGKLSLPQHAN